MAIKKINKAYKFKIKMTDKFHRYCVLNAGHTRYVWNYFWSLNLERLYNRPRYLIKDRRKEDSPRMMGFYEMDWWLNNILKPSEEKGFLKEAYSVCLQQTLRDLDKAYKDAFDKNQPLKRIPKAKKKHKDNSFRFIFPKRCKLAGNQIKIPKFGWVRLFKSRDIKGTPKNVTISKDGNDWYVSIQCEEEVKVRKSSKRAIGIDVGVKTFATCAFIDRSKYKFKEYASENYGKKYQDKKVKLQRHLSKKKKFSNNWRKQNVKVNKVTRKIKNCRHDYLHKVSTSICKNHAKIFVEDLKITNITKSSKGTIENPGKNVSQKSGLNKSILDQGWGMFREMLKYKAEWNGGELVRIDPKYTSQTCHQCGYKDKENRKKQEIFECLKCQCKLNADRNAAINILTLGQREIACQVKVH